jgi:hypothetical protein
MAKNRKTTFRYFIYLFRNKEAFKLLHKSAKKETILDKWFEFKTQKPPLFLKENNGKKRTILKNELVLIYPKNYRKKPIFDKDELGRLIELKLNNENYIIKEKIPYWEEELIYDFDIKKRIRFHEVMEYIETIHEICQIYKLNNKVVIQTDEMIKLYGNKNLSDSNRLFNLIMEQLLIKKKINFLFSRDVSTSQRVQLYDILEKRGYSRKLLFRHYSY